MNIKNLRYGITNAIKNSGVKMLDKDINLLEDIQAKLLDEDISYKHKIDIIKNQAIPILQKYEIDIEEKECLNSKHCIDENTKNIIFGTITPHCGNGYFYTSTKNDTYKILDLIYKNELSGNSLEKIRDDLADINNTKILNITYEKLKGILDKESLNEFNKAKNHFSNKYKSSCRKKIEELKIQLKKINVAFLDVVKYCVRLKNDARDEAIVLFIPISTREIEEATSEMKGINFLSNSENVEGILHLINIDNRRILSPSRFTGMTGITINDKIKDWKEKLIK